MTNEKIEELALKLDQGESPYIVAIQALGLAYQLHSELASLRSCPEMGEVDALVESYSFSSSRQGCKEKFLELADLARRYAVALTEEKQRADEVTHLLRRMLGAVITVRLENTPEWMEYMAEVVNEMNAAIGEADRVETHGDGIRILAICGKKVG